MGRVGGDPRALGAVLTRIAGANHPGMEILSDHPDTKPRVKLIEGIWRRMRGHGSPPQSCWSRPNGQR